MKMRELLAVGVAGLCWAGSLASAQTNVRAAAAAPKTDCAFCEKILGQGLKHAESTRKAILERNARLIREWEAARARCNGNAECLNGVDLHYTSVIGSGERMIAFIDDCTQNCKKSTAAASMVMEGASDAVMSMQDGVIRLTFTKSGSEAYIFVEDAAPSFGREATLQASIGSNYQAVATDMTGFLLSADGKMSPVTIEHNAFMSAKSGALSETLLVTTGSAVLSAASASSGDVNMDRMKQCNLEANGVYSQCLSEVNNDPVFQACNADCDKKFPWNITPRGTFPTPQDRENYEQWSRCTDACRNNRPLPGDGVGPPGPSIIERREACKKKRDEAFSACWRRTAPAAQ
jgi:hypothetical protein